MCTTKQCLSLHGLQGVVSCCVLAYPSSMWLLAVLSPAASLSVPRNCMSPVILSRLLREGEHTSLTPLWTAFDWDSFSVIMSV